MISIYCDGSSSGGSNKPGGWAFLIIKEIDGKPEVLGWSFGGTPSTTNNLMEAMAAIQGMKAAIYLGLNDGSEAIELVSDSQYVIGVASGHYQPVKNLDVVKELKLVAGYLKINFRWTRGHSGDPFNETCDKLAKRGKIQACPELQMKLKKRKQKKTERAKRRELINAIKAQQKDSTST